MTSTDAAMIVTVLTQANSVRIAFDNPVRAQQEQERGFALVTLR
jgi:hypothetical protein